MTSTRDIAEKLVAEAFKHGRVDPNINSRMAFVSDITTALEERERAGYLRGLEDASQRCLRERDAIRKQVAPGSVGILMADACGSMAVWISALAHKEKS